jgi:hypothetical protein
LIWGQQFPGECDASARSATARTSPATFGEHPRPARLLAPAPVTAAAPRDRYADILGRVLTGLLGPPPRT